MRLQKHYLAVLLSASLTGCISGGGSFDVESVDPSRVINNPADRKVTYKSAEKPNPEDFSEMGVTFNSPIPKNLFTNIDDFSKLFTVDPNGGANKHIDEDYDMVNIKYPVVVDENGNKKLAAQEQNISLKITNTSTPNNSKSWEYLTNHSKTTETFDGTTAKFYYDSKDSSTILKLFEFENTKVGLVRVKHTADSYRLFSLEKVLTSNIFYRGKNKTTDVPVSGTAKYKGFWEFATQLHFSDTDFTEGGNSDLTAENSTEFDVDFGTKTLTGTLKSNSSNTAKLDYKVNAKINGNSFTGTATGTYNFSSMNGSVAHNHTAGVSGSFFGKSAAELAGKVIANDNAWAGVFAAKKENGGTDLKTDGDLYQAGVMTFIPPSQTANSSNTSALSETSQPNSTTNNTNSQTYTLNNYQKVNYSGNVDKLQVDGILIDLTQNPDLNKACCSTTEKEKSGLTTQAVKFGKYGYTKNSSSEIDSKNNKVGGYFVQGVLTPTSEIPTTDTAEYDGRWYGYASDAQGTFSGDALDAKFTAKWDTKKLEGKLFNKNQVNNAALSFDATITENSFKAENTKFEVSTDTAKDAQQSLKITVNDIKVEGHFYGKGANELGGHFYSESKRAGGVFGAKQVETGTK